MTHENQREKEKQMENDRRDYACDPIVTEPGNGRSCFVAEYCSNAVCDPAWINSGDAFYIIHSYDADSCGVY